MRTKPRVRKKLLFLLLGQFNFSCIKEENGYNGKIATKSGKIGVFSAVPEIRLPFRNDGTIT